MEDCIFCKIIKRELPCDLIYEDDSLIAFKDINPKADTHILIVPKKHIVSLSEATESDKSLLGEALLMVSEIGKEVAPDGFRTILNTGKGGGQEVDHIHFHLLAGNLSKF